jgi:muramoyltetrapeptide carboxypeptidase LdcA involved in peptidoglycan recycling
MSFSTFARLEHMKCMLNDDEEIVFVSGGEATSLVLEYRDDIEKLATKILLKYSDIGKEQHREILEQRRTLPKTV